MKITHVRPLGLTTLGLCLVVGLSSYSQVYPCFPPPSGIVAWWQGENNTLDHVGGNDGFWVGVPSYAPGEVHTAFNLTGTNYVEVTNDAMNQFTNAMTIELWMINANTDDNPDWRALVAKGNESWRLMCTTHAKTVYVAFDGASPHFDLFGTVNVNDGEWHHIAATYDGTTMCLYVDGVIDVSQSATGAITQDSEPLEIGSDADPPYGYNYTFTGEIDEVSLYNRALTPCEIQSIYLCGPTGKCP